MTAKRDLIIIGGGAGGLVVASVAAQLGLKVTLIEKQDKLGGDCLHYGCVPSKTLIKSAKVAHLMQHAEKYGLQSNNAAIDFAKVTQHVQAVIAQIQLHDDPERFREYGCEVLFGDVKFVNAKTVQLGELTLTAKRFIIATGSRPSAPAIPGLEDIQYLTNENLFSQTQLPKRLLVIGAGVIGLEMAQALHRLGSHVTVVDVTDYIMPNADREVAERLQKILRKEGVEFNFVGKIERVKKIDSEIILYCQTKTGGEITIHGSDILVAAGRKPNIETLELENAQVKFSPRGITVNKKLQSSRKNIYALGDVIDCPYKFTHMAEYQAGVVISNAVFRLPKRIDYRVVPAVVFTDPEFAMVGVTEEQAKGAKILRFEFKDVDRALTEAETAGMAKLIVKNKKIIGASILGLHAGELLAELTLAMQAGISIKQISATIHTYPTLSQVNRRVVNRYYAPKLFSPFTRKIVKFMNRWF